MKIFNRVKTILFALIGIAFLVFSKYIVDNLFSYLNIFLGISMLIFATGLAVDYFVEKKGIDITRYIRFGFLFIAGLFLIFFVKKIDSTLAVMCYIWAFWDIIREMLQVTINIKKKYFKSTPISSHIGLIESVVIVVFSILMVINPVKGHIFPHVILLGVEFILEAGLINIARIERKYRK